MVMIGINYDFLLLNLQETQYYNQMQSDKKQSSWEKLLQKVVKLNALYQRKILYVEGVYNTKSQEMETNTIEFHETSIMSEEKKVELIDILKEQKIMFVTFNNTSAVESFLISIPLAKNITFQLQHKTAILDLGDIVFQAVQSLYFKSGHIKPTLSIQKHFPNIQQIQLNSSFVDTPMIKECTLCKNLKVFSIFQGGNRTYNFAVQVAKEITNMKNLTHLNLVGFPLTDEIIKNWQFDHLKCINLSGSELINPIFKADSLLTMYLERTSIFKGCCSFVKNFQHLQRVYTSKQEVIEKIKKQNYWITTYVK